MVTRELLLCCAVSGTTHQLPARMGNRRKRAAGRTLSRVTYLLSLCLLAMRIMRGPSGRLIIWSLPLPLGTTGKDWPRPLQRGPQWAHSRASAQWPPLASAHSQLHGPAPAGRLISGSPSTCRNNRLGDGWSPLRHRTYANAFLTSPLFRSWRYIRSTFDPYV